MCNAFSCIITRERKVIWKFGVDSHDQLLGDADIRDQTLDPEKITFCKIEISPKNKDYLNPDEWVFKIDMYDMQNKELVPVWWTLDHKNKCLEAHEEWMKELDKILIRKPIINPFDIKPPEEITDDIIKILKEWDSVWASVGDSVWDSVWDSVGASVRDSVWASVWDSVGASVRDSVWDSVGASVWASVRASVWASVWAYTGSFFNLPRNVWKYTEDIDCEGYPFESIVKLYDLGLVPSFDGKVWRLHGGKDAKVIWEGRL